MTGALLPVAAGCSSELMDLPFRTDGRFPPYLVRHATVLSTEVLSSGIKMPKSVSERPQERAPLSRERVLRGAIAIADAGGIGSLTIRSLAQELGVKPMSV